MAHRTPDQIRKDITEQIAAAVKNGTPPWRQPWHNLTNTGVPCNFLSKRRYEGINPVILQLIGMFKGYHSRNWGTAKSWINNVGAHVKRGEESAHVIYYKRIPKRDPETKEVVTDNKGKDVYIPLMREYYVFNVDQVQAPTPELLLGNRSGLVCVLLGEASNSRQTRPTTKDELLKISARYLSALTRPKSTATKQQIAEAISRGIDGKLDRYRALEMVANTEPDFDFAEKLVAATKAKVKHEGSRAFYRPSTDTITMPSKRTFTSMTDYYSTLMHELVHWTERKNRVGRIDGHTYAFGELVAEIGSCFLISEIGLPLGKVMGKAESYVNEWLKQMDKDSKYIFSAATQASKAVDFLLAYVGKQNPKYSPNDDAESDEVLALNVA